LEPYEEEAIALMTALYLRQQKDVLKKLKEDPSGATLDPFDVLMWIIIFRAAMEPFLKKLTKEVGTIVLEIDLTVKLPFYVGSPDLEKALLKQPQTFAEQVNEVTWK